MDFFATLCRQLNLGNLLSSPRPLTGGFLHRMTAITTTTGTYAIKLLNPRIMCRPTAAENFRIAEELEAELEGSPLPILPAKVIHGRKRHRVEGQEVYVFDYFDGTPLQDEQITPDHCRIIGGVLAGIHRHHRGKGTTPPTAFAADWDGYLPALERMHPDLYAQMRTHRDTLYHLQERGKNALPYLPTDTAVCHNDLDPKIVLWRGQECRVIDLECLAVSNPAMELIETALCWSGYESCAVDTARLRALITAYGEAGGRLPTDWEPLYDANVGRLAWLEYNLKRALGQEGNPDQVALGLSEARKTLRLIAYYHEEKETILAALQSASTDTKTTGR